MRALWQDLSKKSGTLVESPYEVPQYPAANVAHNFLNKWFISSQPSDTVTITFAALESVNSFFVAGCNCAAGSYIFRNSVGVPVRTGNFTLPRVLTAIYLGETIQAKSLELTFDLSSAGLASYVDPSKDAGTNLKIKGVGVGCACTLPEKLLNGFTLPLESKALITSSRGGQYLASQYPSLRSLPLNFGGLTWAEVETLRAGVTTLGYGNPSYFDPFDGSTDYEPPLYAVLLEAIKPQRNGNTYSLNITLEEAR